MNIPRDFDELSIQQLRYFAKIAFDAYWDAADRLQANKEFNSTMQHIGNDVLELQKVINKQNQEINSYGKHKSSKTNEAGF